MAQSEKAWGKSPVRYSEESDVESSTMSPCSSYGAPSEWTAAGPSRPHRRRRILSLVLLVFSILGATYFVILYLLPDQLEIDAFRPSTDHTSVVAPVDELEPPLSPLPPDQPPRAVLIPDDAAHVLLNTQSLVQPPSILKPIASRLPYDALVSFFVDGTLPPSFTSFPSQPLDVTYTWVNASSFYLDQARRERLEDEELRPQRGVDKRFRDNGELRGAIRSVASSLRDGLGTVHVISGDYPVFPRAFLESTNETEVPDVPFDGDEGKGDDIEAADPAALLEDARVGQIPTWLDWDSKTTKLQWHFHSELWRLPRSDAGRVPEGMMGFDGSDRDSFELEQAWRDVSLPSFNSFAIEARMGSVNGLGEQFIMSNDDMFFLRDLSTTDFFHPLYGSVLRLESHPNLLVKPVIPTQLRSSPGEWGGLQYANVILSQRFPDRPRMYIFHQPKHLSLPLVHEAEIMFAAELTEAATRGFRESRRGVADVEFAWLVTHLRVERWREALLWSWAVAKLGDEHGQWGKNAKDEVVRVLGLDVDDLRDRVTVQSAPRGTLQEYEAVNHQVGWENPASTTYQFSSFDGHMPPRPEQHLDRLCGMSLARCFPPDFFTSSNTTSASDMFTHIAFAAPECGDCLIMALVNDSGPRGLSAFLPDADKTFVPPPQTAQDPWQRDEPMLPLVGKWLGTDFSLEGVVRSGQDAWPGSPARAAGVVGLRDWSIKLLSRYTYMWSSTPSHFAMIHSPSQLRTALSQFSAQSNIALACLNDDQPDRVGAQSKNILAAWMQERWGGVEADYEKEGHPWLE